MFTAQLQILPGLRMSVSVSPLADLLSGRAQLQLSLNSQVTYAMPVCSALIKEQLVKTIS
jgi:hypothetical protein